MGDCDRVRFEDQLEIRRLSAALESERFSHRSAVERLARLQPAYDEIRTVVRSLQSNAFWSARQTWYTLMKRLGLSSIGAAEPYDPPPIVADNSLDRYERWRLYNDYRSTDAVWLRVAAAVLQLRPRFSIIFPTYNTSERYLRAALDSVMSQVYPEWELCIADDASTDPRVLNVLHEYARADARVRVAYRSTNGHISAASNSALALATGEYIVLLDHDDLLSEDALFFNALTINEHPDVDMLYSDEDKIDDDGRRSSPFFKPDWSPETLLSRMYTSHLGVYRAALVREIGGFRESFEGSQDYDLVLRLTERTTAIKHIPRILYHWRLHSASTTTAMTVKPYSQEAAVRALSEALARRGKEGAVRTSNEAPGSYTIRYAIRNRERVSVVILAPDRPSDLVRCVQSLLDCTSYQEFEGIVVAPPRADDAWSKTLAAVRGHDFARLRCVISENVKRAAASNDGASIATGKYLLFLAGDSEIVDRDWMTALVEYAEQEAIGVTGAKLIGRDGRLVHAGIVTGLTGIAGYGHRGAPGDTRGYFDQVGAVTNVSAVSSACLMIRREVFERLGAFDPQLGPEYAGLDLCLKVLGQGLRVVYLPHVRLTAGEPLPHKSGEMDTFGNREQRALLDRRWAITRRNDPYYNPNLTLLREDYTPGP